MRTLAGTALVVLVAVAVYPAAKQVENREGWVWHTVREGETLQTITAAYMGNASRWQENWRLNPELADPHSIRPGQRIRVLVGPTAQVDRVARRVDEKRPRSPWKPTQVGAQLSQGDGIRTRQQSSAVIAFEDQSEVLVTENSLLFLRNADVRGGAPEKRSIEIRLGQADVALPRASSKPRDIEIVVGGTTVTASASEGSAAHSRSRLASKTRTQVMVYEGASRVESGGAELAVPPGMGTTTTSGGLGELESLLPAPRAPRPENDALVPNANPVFEWTSVVGAQSYILEVCRDPACGVLVERQAGIVGTEWQPSGLPMGRLYWRVTAVSGSGLDGYASRSQLLTVESLWRKRRDQRR